MSSAPSKLVLAAILVGYAVLCLGYATKVPTWNAPDEPAHYNYVMPILRDHQLPVLQSGDYNQHLIQQLTSTHFADTSSISKLRYENHQPPLYYLAGAITLLPFQHRSARAQVIILRLLTALFGGLSIVIIAQIVAAIFPKRPDLVLATAAFVAFIPMHVFMDSAVDNDALAELLLGLVTLLVIRGFSRQQTTRGDVLIGLLVGATLLTKLVAYASVLLVIAGYYLQERRVAMPDSTTPESGMAPTVPVIRAFVRLARTGLVAFIVSGWWFVRDAIVYGPTDIFGLRRHHAVVHGQPLTGTLTSQQIIRMAQTAFHSFWGQFGWMGVPYNNSTYAYLMVLSVVATIGFILYLFRVATNQQLLDSYQRIALAILGLNFLIVLVGTVVYNVTYLQPQGRYLFPALPTIGLFAILGVNEVFARRYAIIALASVDLALFYLSGWSLFRVILPALTAG